MLEGIERQDDVRFLICPRRERTSIRNTTLRSRCARVRKRTLTNVNANHFPCPTRGHFNRILTVAAPEVDHDFIFSVTPDFRAEQFLDLANALIRTAITVTRFAIDTDSTQ
jgi:hypothetical protein